VATHDGGRLVVSGNGGDDPVGALRALAAAAWAQPWDGIRAGDGAAAGALAALGLGAD
jgi:hypothetical protein